MRKSKAVRVAGFVGAIGASAALVGFAATGTGAYFTDSHDGTITTSTGVVQLALNTPADGVLNFANLLPGEYQTKNITYTGQGSEPEDVWLVFPMGDGTGLGNPSEAFTGKPDDNAGGGLGRYGHLAIDAPAGSFTSYNLNNPGTTSGHTGPSCPVDGNGHGGSNQQLTGPSDHSLPFCAPANAILLSSNLGNGATATAKITFGYTPLLKQADGKTVSYQIVATQHGIRPDNPFN
jgi:hypothetical protein